jgi:methyl-accepting chemotaxis protein
VTEAFKNGNLDVRADVIGLKGECVEAAEVVNEILACFSKQMRGNYIALLANSSNCTQLVDTNYTIVYMNPAMDAMLADAEPDIRKQLPSFDRTKLIGMDMDAFHKHPTHQRNLLDKLTTTLSAEIRFGVRTFTVVTTILFDSNGVRTGAMVEWTDITALNSIMAFMEAVTKGDLDQPIISAEQCQGRDLVLQECTLLMRDNLRALVADASVLSVAAVEGKLSTRADVTKHQGDFRKIVEGVNDTLDAVIGPLNVAADYVEKIAKGAIPAKITDTYNGDFNILKNNLNTCIDAVNALVADASVLSVAAVEGKLATRADASKHQGDFRKIVEGVNDTLDAVIGPLNVAADYVDNISKGAIPAKITDTYNGDFNILKNNLNTCIDAVNALVADAGVLSVAAVEGKLATRADATKHQGDFRKIVEGVNETLDAVIGPLNVAADYVDNISKGAIPAKITATYNGDFNILKNNLNTCIDAINALVADASVLSVAAVDGKLSTRADATKHQGDFRKIVEGVNETLDAVIGPLNVAADYVDNICLL